MAILLWFLRKRWRWRRVKLLTKARLSRVGMPGLLLTFWMRIVWGYPLGFFCGFGHRLLKRLREYPLESGSKHKQVALEHAGLLGALLFGSEGGIDGSNLAYSYVSLPLNNADELAQKIQKQIRKQLGKSVCVVIADTDKTYKFHNFYFTPRPNPLKGHIFFRRRLHLCFW